MKYFTPNSSNRIQFIFTIILASLCADFSFSQQISGGGSHTLLLCKDKSLMTFGSNSQSQLAMCDYSGTNTPIPVYGLNGTITAISAGYQHSLVLMSDKTVWAWGDDTYGQLGDGTTSGGVCHPIQIPGLTNVVAISAGQYFSLAIKSNGTVWAWGDNTYGQLGNGTKQNNSLVPVQVSGLTGIISIRAGDNHSMALRNDNTVFEWGYNGNGQLGNGTFTDTVLPTKVPSLVNVTAIAAGGNHSLALLNSGLVIAWGSNSQGQLGDGTTKNDSVPALVQLLSNVTAISAGGDHSLALKSDSTVWMWGFNMNPPSIHNNPTINTAINGFGLLMPVKVNGLSGITKISCGQNHNLAYKNDGTFWGWGEGFLGQLGDGMYSNAVDPLRVVCPCGSIIAPTVSAGADITICPNANVVIHATGNGLAPFTFQWSLGNFVTRSDTSSPAINYNQPGTYTCAVSGTDRNLCPAALSDSMLVTVRYPSQPPYYSANPYPTVCNGNAVTLNAFGGAPLQTYVWFPGGNSTTAISVTPTTNTTYSLVSTDVYGCAFTQTISIDLIDPAINVHNVNCSLTNNGFAMSYATGGSAPYTYVWSTGETTSGIYNLIAGNYSVTVTDANGCSATKNFQIIDPGPITIAQIVKTDISCNGFGDGKAHANITGGSPPYNITWSGSNYISTPNSDTITSLLAGTYSVSVMETSQCSTTTTGTVTIAEPALLTSTVNSTTNVTCYGSNNGMANVTAAGGITPYTYSWSPSAKTTSAVTGLAPGAYTMEIIDHNQCKSAQDVYIIQPASISLSNPTVHNVSCPAGTNGDATLNTFGGVTPYTYLWSPSSQTTNIATHLAANTYSLSLTDHNGCHATQTVLVTQPNALAANIAVVNVSCNGMCDGTAVSNPTGGTSPYSFSWNIGGSSSALSNLCQGTYSLTITDLNNCTINSNTVIAQPTVLTSSMTVTNLSCNGVCIGTSTVIPSGGTLPYNYVWSNGQITQAVSELCAGNYTVTVIDDHDCSVVDTISIYQPLPIPITVTATATSCGVKSGSASATINGPGALPPFHLLWNTGDTTLAITNLAAGIYRMNVTDNHGCFSFADAMVSNSNGPTITTNTIKNVTCNGLSNGAIDINITGGSTPYKYHWSNGATTQDLSNVSYGPYEIVVSDAGGCTATQSIFVNEPAKLSLTSSVINSSCTVANGSAFVSAAGGNSPYSYLWSVSGTTSTATGLGAGVYKSQVTDSKGCIDSLFIAVSDSGGPVAVVDTIVAANCGGGGFALITPQDSASIATYHWSNGMLTQNLSNVTSGNYGLVITDTSGCKRAFMVPVNPALPPIKPLCVVTVDTLTNENMVVWEKPISTVIAGFKIYRESSKNGIYQFIKYLPYSSVSTYYDAIVNPDDRWSKYRISMVDVCGKEGPQSPVHKTIHLSVQSTTAGSTTLIWDDYEGYNFTKYHIFRKDKYHGAWTLIDSVPASVTTYKDNTVPQNGDTIYYHIDVTNPNSCVATIKNDPIPDATTVRGTKSNSDNRLTNAVLVVGETNTDNWLKIFPNPNHGTFTISSSKEQISFIRIFNMFGELLYEKNIYSNKSELTIPEIASGIYELRVDTKNGITNRKIVISK